MKWEETYADDQAFLQQQPSKTPPTRKEQAEISFKAGFKYALEGAVANGAYDSIKKLGRQEVVEWVEANLKSIPLTDGVQLAVYRIDWQSMLKEWGIE